MHQFLLDDIYGIAVYLAMLWEFIELPPFVELRDSLFSDDDFLNTAGQIILVAAYGKGERDDVPRPWLKRIKEAFEHEQG